MLSLHSSIRLACFVCVALVAASDPAVQLLRGHDLWLFIVALMITVLSGLAVQKGVLRFETASEIYANGFAMTGTAVAYSSRFGIDGMPFLFRSALLTLTLLIWWWLGHKTAARFAPETKAERARP
jgi:hypothetical protein